MIEYGLIGLKLEYSFSKDYFNSFFKQHNIDACYKNFEIENIVEINKIIETTPNLYGFNVTIPYKQEIIPFLDDIHPAAKEVGAVNVVKIKRDESGLKMIGYNTDIIGFEKSIMPFLEHSNHKRAIILGTGGASKAIDYVLRNKGIETLFVGRNKSAIDNRKVIQYSDLDSQTMSRHTIIVNCTPCGTSPKTDETPPINFQDINSSHFCYDLIYNPAETLFLKLAKLNGATIKNGLEMLHIQAEYAWKIWDKQ